MVAIRWLNATYTALDAWAPITANWWSAFATLIAAPYMACFDDGWCFGVDDTALNTSAAALVTTVHNMSYV